MAAVPDDCLQVTGDPQCIDARDLPEKVRQEGSRAVEQCQIDAGNRAAAAQRATKQVAELRYEYDQYRRLIQQPTEFIRYALGARAQAFIDSHAWGDQLTPEGEAAFGYAAQAARYGAQTQWMPLVREINRELVDIMIEVYRRLLVHMDDLDSQIEALE